MPTEGGKDKISSDKTKLSTMTEISSENVRVEPILDENDREIKPADDENDRGGAWDGQTDCTFDKNRLCLVHGSVAKKVDVSVLKWRWIESKKEYGNVRTRISKLHCTAKNKVPADLNISPTVQLYSGKRTAGIRAGWESRNLLSEKKIESQNKSESPNNLNNLVNEGT